MIPKELNENKLIKFKLLKHITNHSKLGKWSKVMCVPLISQPVHVKTTHSSSSSTKQISATESAA
jgi:hypothetical protein